MLKAFGTFSVFGAVGSAGSLLIGALKPTGYKPGTRRPVRARAIASIQQAVEREGYALTDDVEPDEVIALASDLGKPVPSQRGRPITDTLRPMSRERAQRPSPTASHGTGAFPLHTDGAHWVEPPRLVLLYALEPGGSRPTLICDLKDAFSLAERALLATAIFRVRNGRLGFLANALSTSRLRYDPGCMFPETATAVEAAQAIGHAAATKTRSLHWRRGQLLVVDNARCLHGRGSSPAAGDAERTLLRVLVM